ncbi:MULTISPECIES: glycosyltransferase [unclassified Luteococcus]|uniref:glycosyltransferase n=1 Tax=unclassified Luteococcus TaxID=2639923 RepID=UPI00313F0796
MKIIQVATVITPENAYGGPTTVAFNHCRALRDAGHDVTLVAGAQGFEGPLPDTFQDVPVKLFPVIQVIPGAGFAGLASPQMLAWLRRHARQADAVHVHLARDFVTLPAASLVQNLGVRTCVQTHGMIDPSQKLLARPLDAALTRRVLRAAARVFHLTEVERQGVLAVGGPRLRVEELHNGLDADSMPSPKEHAEVTVLYLARLQARKRPLVFVQAATELAREFPEVGFRMVGPDEGEGPAVAAAIQAAGLGRRLRWDGPADRAGCQEAMATADLYVLPSVDEPYPMSVLEALAARLPVVLTDTCGLAPAVARGAAGTVTTNDPAEIAAAIRRYLADPGLRRQTGERAQRLIRDEFSMRPIVEQLVSAYRGA